LALKNIKLKNKKLIHKKLILTIFTSFL